MKKLLLLSAVFFCAATISAQNLVVNGDFEEWNSMTGEPKSWGRDLGSMLEKSTECQSGEYSVRLNMDSFGSYFSYIQAFGITLEQGKTYEISFYYKQETGVLTAFTVSASYPGVIFPETLFSEDLDIPTIDEGWKKFSMTHTENTGRTLQNFQILVRSAADASILIDNVIIRDQAMTSLSETEALNLSVYFDEAGNISIDGMENAKSVNIYSLDGKFAADRSNASSLINGAYLVVVEGDGVIVSKKVIKQ